MSRREQKTGRAALCGMLIALAFLFSYVETLIPISLGIPGAVSYTHLTLPTKLEV